MAVNVRLIEVCCSNTFCFCDALISCSAMPTHRVFILLNQSHEGEYAYRLGNQISGQNEVCSNSTFLQEYAIRNDGRLGSLYLE